MVLFHIIGLLIVHGVFIPTKKLSFILGRTFPMHIKRAIPTRNVTAFDTSIFPGYRLSDIVIKVIKSINKLITIQI